MSQIASLLLAATALWRSINSSSEQWNFLSPGWGISFSQQGGEGNKYRWLFIIIITIRRRRFEEPPSRGFPQFSRESYGDV